MGRPRGSTREGSHKLATQAAITSECKARFRERFGRAWSYDLADRILEDDALSIRAIIRRSGPLAAESHARTALNALRSRALAAHKALRSAGSGPLAKMLQTIVKGLPPELLAAEAAWKRTTPGRRARVMLHAPRVIGERELAPIDLAVIGLLAGVRVRIHRGDMVGDVLRREARCYSSARRR